MPERCVDASLAIKWVVKGEVWRRKARQFLHDSIAAGFALIAPPLYEYETESVIQERVWRGALMVTEADIALRRLAAVGVQIIIEPGMVRRARALARQFNQPRIYDSLYASLAELRGCDLWTADRVFYEAVKSSLSFVRYLPTYQ